MPYENVPSGPASVHHRTHSPDHTPEPAVFCLSRMTRRKKCKFKQWEDGSARSPEAKGAHLYKTRIWRRMVFSPPRYHGMQRE